MNFRSHVLCVTATIVLAGSAIAQNPTSPTYPQGQPSQQPGSPGAGTSPTMDRPVEQMTDPFGADKKFVKEAAAGSLAEVELGKLAQEKGSSDAIKEFGKRMVEDHGKANEELQQAAAKANISTPGEMPRKARKAQEKLSKLSGPDFDRTYAKLMLDDHKDDVKAFEKQSRNGKVPEVKEFAAKMLPTLQEHKKMAEELEASTNGKAKSQN